MKRLRAVWLAAGAALSACLIVGPTASAAVAADDPAKVEWSAEYGTSTASGLRWVEPGSVFSGQLMVQGNLENNGSGCYSVWTRWTRDMVPLPESRQATVCGTDSVPVDIKLDHYLPTTNGYLRVCKGQTNADCGESIILTSWPIGDAAPHASPRASVQLSR